jgi:LacI family transcriptional regulator
MSDLTDPALTSVEQHGYIVGKEAVGLLINKIENKEDMIPQTKVIKTELVIKGSTKS